MRRMIAVVDPESGVVSVRTSDTPTLDLPQDFDRAAAQVQLDLMSRVRYLSMVTGKEVVRPVQVRPLSWRVHGEDCLVSDASTMATASRAGSFRLSTVE